MAAALREFGPDHTKTLSARMRRAEARGQAGAFWEAAKELRDVLDAECRDGGPLAVRAVKARARLAHWQVADGRPEEALALTEELLTLQLDALPHASEAVLDTRSRIADLRIATGDARGAVEGLRTVLTAVVAGAGAGKRLAATRRRLAHALEAVGDMADAAEQWELLAAGYDQVPDGARAATARQQAERLRSRLGGTPGGGLSATTSPTPPSASASGSGSLSASGSHVPSPPAALPARTDPAAAFWATAEPGSPAVLKSLGSLTQGRVDDEVLSEVERLVDRWRTALGEDAPAVLTARTYLAEALGQAGDRAAAAEELTGVVEALLEAVPSAPTKLYAARRRLAHWQESAGDYEGAAATVTAALDAQSEHAGPLHPVVLSLRARLADIRMHAGDPAAAASEYRVLIAATTRTKGAGSAAVLALQRRLASALIAAGRSGEAVETLRGALTARSAGGVQDEAGSAALRSLAFALLADADVSGSLAAFREMWRRQEEHRGPTHPETLAALRALAYAEHDAGEFDAAIGHAAELLERRRSVLHEDHPDTRAVAEVLDAWRASRDSDLARRKRRSKGGRKGGAR
ncbi:hypothetical protein [Streptomyces sp. NPDC097619]|uniref:hypothetical protein n=1 Tax=Streptomyces sp. NPDC097619 TaxID=3157228 RepID=UPI003329A057